MAAHLPVRLTHLAVLLSTCGAVWIARPAVASERLGGSIAQPATYTSPSGAYSLSVDPADRKGAGGAEYRFSKRGEEVWAGEREYTLRAVTVTDEGCVVGIAYRSVPTERDGKPWDPDEYFHIVILDSEGRERLNDVEPRPQQNFTSTPPVPKAPYGIQLIVDPDNDRVVVRMEENDEWFGRRGWRIYSLSTGKLEDKFKPKDRLSDPGNASFVIDSRIIPNTPLILVHWFCKSQDYKVKDAGARFTLVGLDGRPVWSYDVENDYVNIDLYKHAWAGYGPSHYFRKCPAILCVDQPNRFDLRLFSENQRVTFAVERKGKDEWLVSEVARVDYVEPDATASLDAPKGTLRYLGELTLGTAQSESSPFGAVGSFTFDKEGNLHLWRRARDDRWGLAAVDQTGKVVGERWFDDVSQGFKVHWTDTARIKDNRFVWLRKDAEDSGEYSAWLVDLVTGKEAPFEHYPGGSARSISRFADGGFVILDTYSQRYSPADRFSCYDASGKLIWQKRSDNHGDREILEIGPRDVAVTSDQRIVLLNMRAAHLLGRDGKHIKKIDLTGVFQTKDFGGKPIYISEVVADADGGFLIKDSTTPPIVLRFNPDGSVRSRWSPRHTDGRTFDIRPGIRVAPDGRLWTSDGRAVMRLTDDGVVDLVLGEPPQADRLDRIVGFTVDYQDRLYAVAHGTGAVHVFDRFGRLLRIDEPDPTDFAGTVREAFIAVTDRGDVYVQRPNTKVYSPPDEYLRFSPNGERMEVVTFEPRLETSTFGPGWAFQPGTGYRGGLCPMRGDDRLMLIDPPDKVVWETRKRPNGKWFSFTSSFAMAPNGSMAVLSSELGGDRREYEVDFFSATGDPIRTIPLPRASTCFTALAYNGERFVVAGPKEVLIGNVADDTVERWSLVAPGIAKRKWEAYIVAEGRELLLFEGRMWFQPGRPALHRYELP